MMIDLRDQTLIWEVTGLTGLTAKVLVALGRLANGAECR